MNLKAGDIVKYKNNARMCNGLYGQIVEHEDMLVLLDNENAPEIFGLNDQDEELLEVVGRIETYKHLLDIFVSE